MKWVVVIGVALLIGGLVGYQLHDPPSVQRVVVKRVVKQEEASCKNPYLEALGDC